MSGSSEGRQRAAGPLHSTAVHRWGIMRHLTGPLAIVILVLTVSLAFAGPAEDVSSVIDQWAKTFSANDADALVKLYAPDATLLGTVSPTLAEGTAAIRAYFARLPGSGSRVTIGERRVVVLTDSAVLATGFYEFTAMRSGQPVPMPARFTLVLTKRGSEWLIAHHHSSSTPKPPQ